MDEISDPCMGCIYQVNVGGYLLCDYLLMTGHCRPSPFGVECRESRRRLMEVWIYIWRNGPRTGRKR